MMWSGVIAIDHFRLIMDPPFWTMHRRRCAGPLCCLNNRSVKTLTLFKHSILIRGAFIGVEATLGSFVGGVYNFYLLIFDYLLRHHRIRRGKSNIIRARHELGEIESEVRRWRILLQHNGFADNVKDGDSYII